MLEREIIRGVALYVSPLLSEAAVPHAFSTRMGGLSPAPFASLNLGNPSTGIARDTAEHIEENWRRFAGASGIGDRPIRRVSQVHGAGVVEADRRTDLTCISADAIVTRDPDCAAAVRVADCVPILLAGDDGSIVAAVHAGWRGVVAGVVPKAIERMRRQGAKILVAAVGPCIGFEAFEVGEEVAAQFRNVFAERALVTSGKNGKAHVDLREAVRLQLLNAGLETKQIDTTDRCTVRDADEFFSHRRDDGLTGRLAAVIAPR
jgi:polyphenol oxidase